MSRPQKRVSLSNDVIHPTIMGIFNTSGNSNCCDCDCDNPEWCSLYFGSIICLECAGMHRSLGVHITLVKSLLLDTLSDAQIQYLLKGGNKGFRNHLNNNCKQKNYTSFKDLYNDPCVLYYKEILKSKIDGTTPIDLDTYIKRMNNDHNDTNGDDSSRSIVKAVIKSPCTWILDKNASECMVCARPFTLFVRRHHCRRCGVCVCVRCAPAQNTRPILEWNLKEPVRHCKLCYMSPLIEWDT